MTDSQDNSRDDSARKGDAGAKRFDVFYNEHGATLDYHFCREWEGGNGCYGTNPNHGFTFHEARDLVADWYQKEAERWRYMKLEEWERQ